MTGQYAIVIECADKCSERGLVAYIAKFIRDEKMRRPRTVIDADLVSIAIFEYKGGAR